MKPVWIVDDDQSIRFVLEKALQRENLPTRSFTNPRDLLAALSLASEEDAPQVLVSDIRMPGGSGLDLLDKVKQKYPGLPVIIMTAYSDLDSAVSAFQGGAFEYLPKPFDLPKVIYTGKTKKGMNDDMVMTLMIAVFWGREFLANCWCTVSEFSINRWSKSIHVVSFLRIFRCGECGDQHTYHA